MGRRAIVAGFVISMTLAACAAVSGLDDLAALPVCSGACDDAATDAKPVLPRDAGVANDSPAPDMSTADGGTDAPTPTDAQSDTTVIDDDAGPPDVTSIPCADGSTCSGSFICCLDMIEGASCRVRASCDGVAVTCSKASDCESGNLCCGVHWLKGTAESTMCELTCDGSNDLILCDPFAQSPCPNGTTCTGSVSKDGVTVHVCSIGN